MIHDYPKGTRLAVVSILGQRGMPPGLRGTVQGIDGTGAIKMVWDNGRTLPFTSADNFRRLTEKEIAEEQSAEASKQS